MITEKKERKNQIMITEKKEQKKQINDNGEERDTHKMTKEKKQKRRE